MDLQDSNTFYEQISLKVDFLFFAVFSWWLLFLVSAMKRTELLHPTIFSACCLFKAIYSKIPRAVESNNGFVLSSLNSCVCVCLLFHIITYLFNGGKFWEKLLKDLNFACCDKLQNLKAKIYQFQQLISCLAFWHWIYLQNLKVLT